MERSTNAPLPPGGTEAPKEVEVDIYGLKGDGRAAGAGAGGL